MLSKHHRKIPKRVVSAMKGREDELDSLSCDSEEAVRDRIPSIVDYLSELQVKWDGKRAYFPLTDPLRR
jgi:hypothetical protein